MIHHRLYRTLSELAGVSVTDRPIDVYLDAIKRRNMTREFPQSVTIVGSVSNINLKIHKIVLFWSYIILYMYMYIPRSLLQYVIMSCNPNLDSQANWN